MIKNVLFFLLLGSSSLLRAQIILQGKVCDQQNKAIPFANVALLSAQDSTQIIRSDMTDVQGNYILNNVHPGIYTIVISAISNHSLKEQLNLRMPTATNVLERSFKLETVSYNLSGITIHGNRKQNDIGKHIYIFSDAQIKSARYAADLLSHVEDLTTDLQTGEITRLNGSAVKILINGINANSTDLKSIPADKILRVVYYTVPPLKYMGSGTVIDVITRNLDTGVTGGVELSHAFTTGFFNDNTYWRFVRGNHQISMEYKVNYRHYSDRYSSDLYNYYILNKDVSQFFTSHERFGYTDHEAQLKYTYIRPEKATFQMTLVPFWETRFNDGNGSIKTSENNQSHKGNEITNERDNVFGPSLDLYFSKKLQKKQELSLDLLGTYYYSRQNKFNFEQEDMSATSILDDRMKQQTRKYSIIGEIAYSRKYMFGELHFGLKSTFARSTSTMQNIFSNYQPYEYSANSSIHYLYGEYSGMLKQIMYQISIGGTNVYENNDITKFNKFLFTPRIVLARNFGIKHTVQYQLLSNPTIPAITQLSNNSEQITSYLLHTGNPYLKSELNLTHIFSYNLKLNMIDMSVAGVYDCTYHPIVDNYITQYINNRTLVIDKEGNASSFFQIGSFYSLVFKPFKDLFSIKLYGVCLKQTLNRKNASKVSNWYAPLFYQLSLQNNGWGISYRGAIVSKQIDGSFLKKDENVSQLNVYYQHKSWRLTVGCLWLFTKSKYSQESLKNPIMYHSGNSYINDNQSMFVIGVSWNLQKGKHITLKRKIENKDLDKGLF